MAYERKTIDVFDVQGNYGQGWETVTCELSRREAIARKREYVENEAGVPFRIKVTREPIERGAE